MSRQSVASWSRLVVVMLSWVCLLGAVVGCGGAVDETAAVQKMDQAPRPDAAAALDPNVARLIAEAANRVDAEPDAALLWGALGKIYHANELFDLAATTYRQALERDSATADVWYQLARVEERRAELDAALAAMDRSQELEPDYFHGWWRRGDWLYDADRTEEARAAYQRALELQPQSPIPRTGLARLLLDQGETDEAIEALREVLQQAPEDSRAHALLGDALRRAGRPEEAERHLRRGQEGRLIRDDDWANELVALRVGFGARVQLATQYFNDGQLEAAEQILVGLHGERPDDIRVATKLAKVYLRSGRPEPALSVLEASLAQAPEDFRVHLELAASYRELGDFDRAWVHARRAVELNPTQWVSHARLAAILESLERFEPAAQAYGRALQYEPGETALWISAGNCFSRLGRWGEAAEHYERALALTDTDADLFVRYGFAALQTGRLEAAESALNRGLELGPRAPDRVEQLLRTVRARRAAG